MLQEEKLFVQYVRDENRNRIGVVVGLPNGDKIGWSKIRFNKDGSALDHFDRELGIKIAVGRALNGTRRLVPPEVQYVVDIMTDRLYRYKNPKAKEVV